MMRRIGNPPRYRKGCDDLQEEGRHEPHHTRRIHTKECSEDDP